MRKGGVHSFANELARLKTIPDGDISTVLLF